MNCKQAKQLDLVRYLEYLNIYPKRMSRNDYYYLSPLREESDPSFHVNRKDNVWFDHGGDKGGGTIIDFGIAYHHCSISEFLQKLEGFASFHQPSGIIRSSEMNSSQSSDNDNKIIVQSTGPILSPALIQYLRQRKIPEKLAQLFCCEVKYQLYQKFYYAIGFKNDGGGFELRNPGYKSSSKPKGISFIDRGFLSVEVFEGFFSFLSFLTVIKDWEQLETNFLILNSISFFNKSRDLMERYEPINLHLDRDKQGILKTNEALASCTKYRNASIAYLGYKDWNKFLTGEPNSHLLLRKGWPRNV